MPTGHADSIGTDRQAWYGTAGGHQQHSPRDVRRSISICVDDFGLHEGINEAAVELALARRISAIACLADGPAWHSGTAALRQAAAVAEIGLHLNFTEDFGGGHLRHPLPRLILLAYARRLDPASLAFDIRRQYERVASVIGRPPDFIDGHQHVHQLPGIRDALMHILRERRPAPMPWLRSTQPASMHATRVLPLSAHVKSRVIASLGAPALRKLAAAGGCRQNGHLLGVYAFDGTASRYADHLKAWFAAASDGDLLMCHPSVSGTWQDPIRAARIREYEVLSGDSFPALLERAGIRVGPLHSAKAVARDRAAS